VNENPKRHINDMTREEIASYLARRGIAPYRAGQICQWLYRKHAASFDEMTNLSQELREHLKEHFSIVRLREKRRITSRTDGTTKYLLRLEDRRGVESVYLPHPRGVTLCVSSQVGCAFQCRICATGTRRLKRNLTPGEIIDQIRFLEEQILSGEQTKPKDLMKTGEQVQAGKEQKGKRNVKGEGNHSPGARAFSNVVLMGMGEPFANYDNVIKAIHLMIDEMGIGSRRITVSTCGLPEKIVKFADEPFEVGLAISLNSPFDSKRKKLMPVAAKTPVRELIDAARIYFEKKNRMPTFEYVMVEGMNDRLRDAYALADLLRGLPAKLNLIALNPFPGSRYQPPEASKIRKFQAMLEARGQKATLRMSKGSDILAGCGQLGLKSLKKGSEKQSHVKKADVKKPHVRKAHEKKGSDKERREKRVRGKAGGTAKRSAAKGRDSNAACGKRPGKRSGKKGLCETRPGRKRNVKRRVR
jgi:23S rRNA (adenine2503-C2)-methyltransferase